MKKRGYKKVPYECFLDAIKKAYSNSHEIIADSFRKANQVQNRNIIRGRGHCVSGIIEDVLAQYLKEALPMSYGELVFFVDQPIMIDDAKQARYPDLLICRMDNGGYRILYGVELKANIGWRKGRLASVVNDAAQLCELIRSAKKIRGKMYEDRDKYYAFTADNKFKYDVLIAVAPEGRGEELIQVVDNWKHGHGQRTRVFVLCEGEANEWYDKNTPAKVNHTMFNEFFARIKKCVATKHNRSTAKIAKKGSRQ